MKYLFGDIIELAKEGNFDVIIHGCNCFCTMGAGIAKAIKKEFPEAFAADLKTKKGDRDKLGSFTHAKINRNGYEFIVINAYTQYDWRGNGIKSDYDAIQKAFREIKTKFSNSRIAYPLIGAGLAGGNWESISKIIDNELLGLDHTLVKLPD